MNWNQVWAQTNRPGSYSFFESRMERAMDKIGYFIQSGVIFRSGEKVLEAGCGDGLILIGLLRLFKIQGFGVDFSENAKIQAEILMQRENSFFNFDIANVKSMNYPDNHFDKVISLGVIEHFENPTDSINELYRVLKPGGQAIIMTPNKLSFGVFDRKIKELLKLWPFGYQTEFSPRTLSKKLALSGFDIIKKESLLRRRLPHDNFTFKLIGCLDKIMNLIIMDWGFYSYVFATKLSMDETIGGEKCV